MPIRKPEKKHGGNCNLPAMMTLGRIADSQSGDADQAVWMLYEKIGELNINWIGFYIKGIPSKSYYCGRGAEALKQLELTDRNAVVSSLEKYIAEQRKSTLSYPPSEDFEEIENCLREMKVEK
jgi:hypothetical protein